MAEQQAALRRVAVLVANGAAPAVVFEAIAREVAELLRPRLVQIHRWERDGSVTVAGAWGDGPEPFPTREAMQTGEPVRIEDVAAAGARVVVDGEAWGHIGVAMAEGMPLPDRIEERLAEVTELVTAAISSSETREQLSRLADEQAALRRGGPPRPPRGAPAGGLRPGGP